MLVPDGAVAEHADPHRRAVALPEGVAHDPVHQAQPAGVTQGLGGRADGDRAGAGAGPPGGDGVVGERHVGGGEHLDVVEGLVDQRPGLAEQQVAAGPDQHLADRPRAHPHLVDRCDAAEEHACALGRALQRADEQHVALHRQDLGLGQQVGAEDDREVATGCLGDVQAAAGEVVREGPGVEGGRAQQGQARHERDPRTREPYALADRGARGSGTPARRRACADAARAAVQRRQRDRCAAAACCSA
ncbi:MAG: hypothetical protein JWO60_812, partial [Frankiales bacterium]|nr:hypothetical protein [Frankiales bacterium]